MMTVFTSCGKSVPEFEGTWKSENGISKLIITKVTESRFDVKYFLTDSNQYQMLITQFSGLYEHVPNNRNSDKKSIYPSSLSSGKVITYSDDGKLYDGKDFYIRQ